jgi:hypothetical protein
MRFAAKYGRFRLTVQPEIVEAYATGASKVIQKEITADFAPGGLRPHEREYVITHWKFNGSYQEVDEVTTVPPDYRIGVYDSALDQQMKAWTDDEREKIEAKLLENASGDLLLLPVSAASPPWPNYDDYKGSVGSLIKKLEEEGHDLEQVLQYERDSQNRTPLVEALEMRISGSDTTPAEEIVVA